MTEDKNLAEDFTIEESIKELDLIVQRLESREISLEDSFVEKKMLKINEDGGLSEF